MKVGAGVLSLAMIATTLPMNVEAAKKSEQPDSLKIGVMSDTHYFSQSLYGAGEDFTTAMNSDRKMLKESGAIIDSTLRELVKDQPDIVVVSGDLTKDGEETNHREFAKKLEDAQKKLPDTKFYVINGNHDINNPNGKDFSSGSATDADTTTVEEFREIYADFGYGEETEKFKPEGTDGGSLSYVAHPADGYTLIAVDSCKYSADQTASGQNLQETGGVIGEELLNWISEEAKEAKENGDVVMVLEHHGVVPHFSQEPTVMKDYLVDNYEVVQEMYADSGVSYVFTGHMHANDIAEYTSEKGNKLYDIETGSLVTYPSLFRSVTVQAGTDETQDGNTFVSEMKSPGTVNYKDFDTGEVNEIADLTAYAKTLTLSEEVICTMINEGVLTPMIESLDVKGFVAGLLGVAPEQVSSTLTTVLTSLLPQTKEEGIPLEVKGFKFLVYYSPEEQAIKLDQGEKSVYAEVEEGVLVIPTDDGDVVRITLPEEVQGALAQAAQEQEEAEVSDSKVQNEVEVPEQEEAEVSDSEVQNEVEAPEQEETGVEEMPEEQKADVVPENFVEPAAEERGLFDPIALKVSNAKLTTCIDGLFGQLENDFLKGGAVQRIATTLIENLLAGKVDEEHTVFDVVETVYQMHLAGNENRPQWLADAIGKIQEGEMLPKIIKQSITDAQPTLAEELKVLSVQLKDLVEKGNDSLATGAAVGLIGGITLDGSQVIGMVDDLGALIPNDLLAPINEIAYNVADSMSNDNNFKEDLNASIKINGVKPWDAETTDPEENQGGNNGGTTNPGGNNNGSTTTPDGGNNGSTTTPDGENNGSTITPGGNHNGTDSADKNQGSTTKPTGSSDNTVKPSKAETIKTGDQTPLVVTFVLLFGSAAVLLLWMLRKNNK